MSFVDLLAVNRADRTGKNVGYADTEYYRDKNSKILEFAHAPKIRLTGIGARKYCMLLRAAQKTGSFVPADTSSMSRRFEKNLAAWRWRIGEPQPALRYCLARDGAPILARCGQPKNAEYWPQGEYLPERFLRTPGILLDVGNDYAHPAYDHVRTGLEPRARIGCRERQAAGQRCQ